MQRFLIALIMAALLVYGAASALASNFGPADPTPMSLRISK